MRADPEFRTTQALGAKLRAASCVTPALMADVLLSTRRATLLARQGGRIVRLRELAEARAWTDLALLLLELDLPLWHIRRIACEAGEWHCALSRQRELPDWLDDAVEASHADLALAILSALVEAKLSIASPASTSVPAASGASDGSTALCCDNFA